jgi:hypothetical protein
MPDGVTPADPGLLASLADELALPGYAMRNMLLGRTGAAGRNLADFALNAIDAPLPGDWIPEISGAEDRPEFTDITGPIDDGLTGSLVNVAGNILTDPVAYIPGAQIAKAAGMAAKAAKAVTPKIVQEGVAKVAKPVGKFMRKVAGAEKIGKPLADVITKAQGAKDVTGRAGSDALVEGLKGTSPRELEAAGEVMLNITKDKATGALRAIDESDTLSVQDRLARYLTENPDVDPAKLADIVQKSGAISKAQWESGKAAGPGGNIFTDLAGQPSSDVVMGAVPGTTGQQGIREYFPRIFQGEDEALAMERAASPSAIKGRKLETTQDVLAYLAEHPEMKLTTNAAEALSQRAAQQAELASRGATGSGLMNLAREQGIELPEELLAKALPLYRASIPRAVVTEGGSDVSQILGGSTTGRSSGLLGIGEQSGTTIVPKLEEVAERALDPYGVGLGSFSGRAKPPATVIEEAAPMDIYGIGSQSGRAKPPVTEAIEDAGESSRTLYGVGGFSGKSKPPVTGAIDEHMADPYGVGAQSGLSKPPVAGAIDERSAADALVGSQSGKAVVGRSVRGEEVASGLRDLGIGAQSGKSAVGKSTAVITGLTEAEKKQARDWLLSQDYKQADPLMRETAEAIAKNLPGDEADVALHFLKGMKGRTGLPKALAALNRPFKSVAVYGAIIPKLGSITRNMVGGLMQKYANPEARGSISAKNAPAFIRDWGASIDDGIERLLGRRLFSKNEFAVVDDAFRQSGGDPRKALSYLKDPVMRGAVERGVLGNNFVDTEQLISQAGRTGLRDMGARIWDWPAAMFKGAEGRMRYGLYKSLIAGGKNPDDAARVVRDAFFDYTISSTENRLARDVIPFGQFMFKAIPQSAKMFAEKPYLASGVANLYAQGRDEPVSPYMEGRLNLPIGADEQGNRQYLSNLGLPFEAMASIPNLSASPLRAGRDVEQSIVGASSPLLKMAYAYTSGRDPMFGSMPGSYSKFAGQDLGAAGSILNQLIGTGAAPLTALQGVGGTIGKITDERTTGLETAANLLTGARVATVDPDKAIRDRLQAYLERDPSIAQFRQFYTNDDSATVQEMLSALKSAKQNLKEKQAALAPPN